MYVICIYMCVVKKSAARFQPLEESHRGPKEDGCADEDAEVGVQAGGVHLAKEDQHRHDQRAGGAQEISAHMQKGREHVHTASTACSP